MFLFFLCVFLVAISPVHQVNELKNLIQENKISKDGDALEQSFLKKLSEDLNFFFRG